MFREGLGEQEKIKERMETKLYLARDVEGEPNKDELKVIRKVEKELSEDPAFIGIIPFGSVVAGYNEKEPGSVDQRGNSSDIDIYVLYDETYFDKRDLEWETRNSPTKYSAFREKVGKICDKHQTEVEDRKISAKLTNINIEEILLSIKNKEWKGKGWDFDEMFCLGVMSRIMIGKKKNQYVARIAQELQKLTPEEQIEVVDVVTEKLFATEKESLSKRQERLPEISDEEHLGILNKRREMWRNRVEKVWGIGKAEKN